MNDTPYNMPSLGLFGKRCRILTGYDKRPFVYRIVNSEWMSNTWSEPPITYQSGKNPVRHDHSENVLIVVVDTLINENSRLLRVALKDVELMNESSEETQEPDKRKYEYHTDHTDCPWYISGEESKCPVTCSQYRDGWNDAMNYIFRNGDGYRPYDRIRKGR